MKNFIRVIALFLISFFSISNIFAYNITPTEKLQLDTLIQKLENNISGLIGKIVC